MSESSKLKARIGLILIVVVISIFYFSYLVGCGRQEKVKFDGFIVVGQDGNPIERIPPGSTAFIKAKVEKSPPDLPVTFRWECAEGQIKVTSEKDHSALFIAPQSEGVKVITVVALLGQRELARESHVIQVTGNASTEGALTDVREGQRDSGRPASGETATGRPSQTGTVSITSPGDGTGVGQIISVQGKVRRLTPGEYLALVVRPIPDDPGQSWWVQTQPKTETDGTWSSYPVYIGLPDDPKGLPFKICAVITSKAFRRGEQLRTPPKGPSACIDVSRK